MTDWIMCAVRVRLKRIAKRYAAPEFGQKAGHTEFGSVRAGQPPIADCRCKENLGSLNGSLLERRSQLSEYKENRADSLE